MEQIFEPGRCVIFENRFWIKNILDRIELGALFKDTKFRLNVYGGRAYLDLISHVPDRDTGAVIELRLSVTPREHFLRSEEFFIDFLHRSLVDFARHEACEAFKVDGELYADPHRSGS